VRILIATSNRAIIGGVEKYLQALAPALGARGHQVAFLYETDDGLAGARIDSPGSPVWMWNAFDRDRAGWAGLRAWKPDIAYYHSSQSVDIGSALVAEFPTILYAHVYIGTCISGRKCHAFPRMQPCHRTFGPTCLSLYHSRRCGGLNPLRAFELYQWQKQRNVQLHDFRKILVASEHMRHEFQANGVSPDRLSLLPLPNTQISIRIPAPPPRIPEGRILFAGRLTDLKGARILIRAISRAGAKLKRPLKLTIAGEGPEQSSLEQFAASQQVSAEFTGFLNAGRLYEVMRDADLLAVPSLWPEPFGLVGIEAGSLGLPSVAFAVGGIPDWLIPGESGEIAPGKPPTADGLADAIIRALTDPDHYNKLRHGALEIATRFRLDRHVSELEEILMVEAGGAFTDQARRSFRGC
jgi:glycosyltransferase involved in cell wall biosynthesis